MSTLYKEHYRQLFNTEVPTKVSVGTSSADIFQHARGFLKPYDLSLQQSVGCPCGCSYCYVPAGNLLAPKDVRGEKGELWGYRVKHKENVVEKLRKHIKKGTLSDRVIYWSGVTDPYCSPPTMSAEIWRTLRSAPHHLRPRRIVVQTRLRPDRDKGVIAEYVEATKTSDGGPPVVFSYSIGTNRNDIIKSWERATPTFEQRLACVSNLLETGLFVVVTLSPFSPWHDFLSALEEFKSLGVAYITILFFKFDTRSANTPLPFQHYLEREMPELIDPDWQLARLAEARSVFGTDRVLVGQEGFASLTAPQLVVGNQHS